MDLLAACYGSLKDNYYKWDLYGLGKAILKFYYV
jgi:hypothetical protein